MLVFSVEFGVIIESQNMCQVGYSGIHSLLFFLALLFNRFVQNKQNIFVVIPIVGITNI